MKYVTEKIFKPNIDEINAMVVLSEAMDDFCNMETCDSCPLSKEYDCHLSKARKIIEKLLQKEQGEPV